MQEENRKLRRGSRSSNSSTPASTSDRQVSTGSRQSVQNHGGVVIDSGSESCGEEARLRTAEAFMSGIQSAIKAEPQSQAELSAELVGEVDSVLSKLMQSINNSDDPSLMPLIVNLQASLKATVNHVDSNKVTEAASTQSSKKKEVALSEFSTGADEPFFPFDGADGTSSKIPWKIRAARKRAMKHHTTGMTKDEFAKIKQSLMQSSANCKIFLINKSYFNQAILICIISVQKAAQSQSYALTRNKSESAIKYYSTHGAPVDDEEDIGAQTEPVTGETDTNELGYASDVCDYNVDVAKSQTLPSRGFLIQPADTSQMLSNSNAKSHPDFNVLGRTVVSSHVKPMSPSIESSLYDRRQRLIQKRAKIFKSSENLCGHSSQQPSMYKNHYTRASSNSVLNLTEHFTEHINNQYNNYQQNHNNYKSYDSLLQIGSASNGCSDDYNNDYQSRKISQESTTTADDEDSQNVRPIRRRGTSTGVRARIARRKKMKDANSMDSALGTLSDQEATSEAYDEDDSVEEKQDSEPMDDWQSTKVKSPQSFDMISKTTVMSAAEMTPETARRNWNSRFSNIKSSFNAASEEDLSKSRSPSLHSLEDRSKSASKERSPMIRPYGSQLSGSASPALLRQTKEDKDKENSIKAITTVSPNNGVPLQKPLEAIELSKSKQPTPNRDNFIVSTPRASKSMPKETSYDERSRAEVLGLVKAGRGEDGPNPVAKSDDMDYQEYMNIISKVRKTKDIARARAEHFRLASMYAKEQKRQEELEEEEERLKIERKKIEAEAKTRPQPLPIMPVYPMVQPKPVPPPKPPSPAKAKTPPPPVPPVVSIDYETTVPTTSAPMYTTVSTTQDALLQEKEESFHGSNQSLGEEKGQLDKIQTELKKSSPSPIKALTQPISLDVGPSQQQLQSESIEPKQEQDSTFSMSNDTTTLSPSHEEQRLDDIEKEHKRQQEIKENLIKAEQEKLQKLREEQMKQEKEREEIRRLEFERLRQIQEEQRQLEEERRRQEEHIRLEQLRIEEERKRQEKLQAEKNAEYNRQRLEMEAKNVAMNEGQRVILDPRLNSMSPHEKVLQERLMQQEMLRQEHRKEESKIRQEKLKLIQQEEMLIGRQEDMLRQIEAERTNLFKQEQLIRKRQQERLQQVRQEKMLLEKQEEMIRIREEQLDQERQRQEKLRQEQMALREQEEAIRKRQEQISKELMSANSMMTQSDEMNLLDNQIFPSNLNQVPEPMETFNINGENDQQQVFMFEEGLNGEGEEEDWSGSGSGSETIDEEVDYECKVEVKQPQIFAPTSVRSIESTIGNAPWAQVTPYLTYSESQSVKAQEEVTAIFSQSVSFTRPGVVTSPESMRTSTNLLTTPDNSLSLQSQLSVEPRSLSSSCANSPPAPVPPLPLDESSDALSPVPGKPPKLETSNSKESKKSNGPKSPRIGGPGSAFKPYASSDNLFDPGNLPRRSNTESSIPNTTKNYPLQNGNTLDSRFFMKGKVPPMHGKVRELKKPVHPPFSTTDTEPEMKECNLSIMDTRKKGKKVPVYSTSETEEEYQAYLKCKPKWHGKGGHKDSWDPLQIQSPPQITQKPVGVLQKPKPQPAGLPVIERGSQIGATPIFVPHQPVEPMKPVVHSLPPLPPVPTMASLPTIAPAPLPVIEPVTLPPLVVPTVLKNGNGQPPVIPMTIKKETIQSNGFQTKKSTPPPPISLIKKSDSIIEVRPIAAPTKPIELPERQMEPKFPVVKPAQYQLEYPPAGIIPTEPVEKIKVNANVSEQHKEITQPEEIKTFEPVINKNQMLNVPNAVKSHSPLSISAERTPDSKHSLSPTLHSGLSDLPKEKSPLSFSSQPSLSDKKEDFSQESEDSKPPKRTTAQQRLQQKLMSEALQKVEFKKQLSSKTAARPNPTIAAMEIMTRKELKAGEMEQRIARGEIPAPPIPTQQQSFFENVASQSKLNKPFQQEIRRSESMMMEKPTISPKPTFQKRLSQENVGSIAPIIVLKKQPKRLDPDEIKVRQEQVVKAREYRVTSPIARVSSSPVPTPQNKIPSPPREPQIRQKMASPVPKVSSSPVQPVPQKMLSPPVQPLPQKMLSPPKEQQKMKVSPEPIKKPIMKKVEMSTEKVVSAKVQATAKSAALASIVPKTQQVPKQGLSNAEIAFEKLRYEKQMKMEAINQASTKKAAEEYEKSINNEPRQSRRFDSRRGHQQARSKSIGSNLAQRLHIASSFGEDDDVSPNKTVLPWASEQPKHSNPGIRKHIAARDRGYQLRMSKSSDSITAAKLLAEANMNSSNLRINQDMSKSMERQMDIYTKTREDIRKILEVAKACSVQDRIKLFNDPTPFTEPPMTMTREERAEAIRREILDAKAQDEVGSGSSDIQMQSPVEAKVKPLRIPMKPKLVESVENTNRPEPGSKLRINHPANTKAPEVKSILRTSTHSMDRSPNSTRAPSADSSLPSSMSETKPKSILVKTKKIPKLVHSNSVNENHNNDTNGGGPKIYAQSATDISGGEDDDSERSRKKSIPLTINTKAQFLEVPHHESGLKKSKSFSNPGQYECAMSDQEKSDKQKTIMAFFDASLNPEEQRARRKTSPMPPTTITSSQVVTRRSTAVSIQQKRAQVSSISDEILGEEDLTNVDEAFESLLNSTFQEAQARGRTRSEHSRGGSKRRSQSSHPSSSSARNSEVGSVSSLSSAAPGLQQKSSRKSSSNSLTSSSSVNRKQSRNKVNPNNLSDQQASSSQVMPNKEVLADPLGALPTSHTKKYLPRQQTWASGTPPPPLPQTPSPTQSEYDTCPDPWEDY